MTTDMRHALDDYVQMRRSMGFSMQRQEKLLAQFADWLTTTGRAAFTIDDIVTWVRLPDRAGPSWLRLRLTAVRGFARYLHTTDPAVPIPPAGLVHGPVPRTVPYLYSDGEITALMTQTRQLRGPLRQATTEVAIGLLAVTGMRIGEVVGLDDSDFDPAGGTLTVRNAKFHKQRLLPLHESTTAALTAYRSLRNKQFRKPTSGALLVSNVGTRLLKRNLSHTFLQLVRRAGLTATSPRCRPTPHCLRHSFAVHTLLQWYRDGGDVTCRLPLLSTYLGHTSPAHTYWYLEAAPELMAQAASRLDQHQASAK